MSYSVNIKRLLPWIICGFMTVSLLIVWEQTNTATHPPRENLKVRVLSCVPQLTSLPDKLTGKKCQENGVMRERKTNLNTVLHLEQGFEKNSKLLEKSIRTKFWKATILPFSASDNRKIDIDATVKCRPVCRIEKRREKLDNVCRNDPNVRHDGPKNGFYAFREDKHKLLYFSIPKVGCSFWKRIIKVLVSRDKYSDILKIPQYLSHNGPEFRNKLVHSQNDAKTFLPTYTSFMFVRDPFSRLLSGYVDKMLVPHILTVYHGKRYLNKYPNIINSTCVLDITFSEFSRYMADEILNKKVSDGHFTPMWHHCNPCELNLTFIGKMETFMDDAGQILSSAGVNITDVVGNSKNKSFDERNDKGMLKDVVDFTFKYLRKQKLCHPRERILQRLWKTFQIRGLLSKDQSMPHFETPESVTSDQFVQTVWDAYDRSGPKSVRSRQRHEAMIEAYSQVPRPVLEKLAQAFSMDCLVFDYNCNITERFPIYQKITPFYFKV